MPFARYRPFTDRVDVPLTGRTWPDRTLTAAPLWVPVDLRDGNQALAVPMDIERKSRLFSLLVEIGYKEIEIGYPSASQSDFDFARRLCLDRAIPDDITISAFTPARPELIDRTFAAMAGARRGIIHLCVPTAPTWRSVVLGASRSEVLDLILNAAEQVLRRADEIGERTDAGRPSLRFEFSPEVFNLTEPDYVIEVCNAVTERWDASDDRPVIHNLPATVEIATPNVYADQIEYMHRNLARRGQVILSVHPHNDQGTGVAAAELAVMAGAQRVEGCLFGNGERTGNVDLVTLALNLFSQGIDPKVDLSAIDDVRATIEHCTQLPVHPRHPYVGDLVYTAFSGTHQDAIRKGLLLVDASESGPAYWDVPYLPIDPGDVGRSYEAVIRVNSQSGKGGVAYLLEQRYGLRLPRPVQIAFSAVVQAASDASGAELTADQLWTLFTREYMRCDSATMGVTGLRQTRSGKDVILTGEIGVPGSPAPAPGQGRGATLAAAAADLLARGGVKVDVLAHDLRICRTPGGPRHVCLVEGDRDGTVRWGAGLGDSPEEATVRAIASTAER
jgi:2-isopropylmalate synthase